MHFPRSDGLMSAARERRRRLLQNQKTPDDNQGIFAKRVTSALMRRLPTKGGKRPLKVSFSAMVVNFIAIMSPFEDGGVLLFGGAIFRPLNRLSVVQPPTSAHTSEYSQTADWLFGDNTQMSILFVITIIDNNR
jgi:hypothetical protein